jgi:hypothetical protein
MNSTASGPSASRAFRAWAALTVAGWLAVAGLALSVTLSIDPTQSPATDVQPTPVKAYSG